MTNEFFSESVIKHIMEISSGECTISDEDIENVYKVNPAFAEIYMGLTHLHEDLKYKESQLKDTLAKLTKNNKILSEASEVKAKFLASKNFSELVIKHIMKIMSDECKISDEEIEQEYERDPAFAEILMGLSHLNEDLNYKQNKIETTLSSIKEKNDKLTQAKQELESTQEKLVESSKMASLGNMAAGIAHELNQPLGSILLNSEMIILALERNKLDKLKDYSKKNIEQVQRATKIITALRQFSREDHKNVRELCSINDLINSVHLMLENKFKLSEIEVLLELDLSLPQIKVSEIQIEQVISNLLINACDAVEDSKEKKITIRTFESEEDTIVLEIEDTGIGIPEDIKMRIFEPFFTTKGIGRGTGLGLSLSYSMAKSNNAELKVEPTEGVGTIFKIVFHKQF